MKWCELTLKLSDCREIIVREKDNNGWWWYVIGLHSINREIIMGNSEGIE